MKPDILFLYDKVKSDQPHSYSWLFHAEHTNGKSSITYDREASASTVPKPVST